MNLENIILKNFTELDSNEKSMVLSWRNDESVRKWMYNSEIILKVNHINFIANLINDTNNQYFLVKDGNENIGVVYFNKIDIKNKNCYFGLYGSSDSKIKGIGRILEEVSINYAFNSLNINILRLEVFSDNIQVRNLHKKYKFLETSTKIVNNKEVMSMELKNENS